MTGAGQGGVATYFLSMALLTFDVGVGYAIWTSADGVRIVVLGALLFGQRLDWRKLIGIAAAGAALLGPVFFDETLIPVKAFWLTVIIAGVVWLKLADRPQETTTRNLFGRDRGADSSAHTYPLPYSRLHRH